MNARLKRPAGPDLGDALQDRPEGAVAQAAQDASGLVWGNGVEDCGWLPNGSCKSRLAYAVAPREIRGSSEFTELSLLKKNILSWKPKTVGGVFRVIQGPGLGAAQDEAWFNTAAYERTAEKPRASRISV